MNFDAPTIAFFQWLVGQGGWVAGAAGVIWLIGRSVDKQNVRLEALTAAITRLNDLVAAHMPPR